MIARESCDEVEVNAERQMTTKDSVMTTRPLMQELFASGLYKRNQGRMVRQITCLTIWLVAAVAAWRCHSLFILPSRWAMATRRLATCWPWPWGCWAVGLAIAW